MKSNIGKKLGDCLSSVKQYISPAYWFFKPANEMESVPLSDNVDRHELIVENRNYAFNNGIAKIFTVSMMVLVRYTSTALDAYVTKEFCNGIAGYTLLQAIIDLYLANKNQKQLSATLGMRCC